MFGLVWVCRIFALKQYSSHYLLSSGRESESE